MKKLLLFIFILSSIIYGQEKDLYFKSFNPGFVAERESFEVSTVVSFLDEDIDEAEYYILVEDDFVLSSAVVNNNGNKFKLPVQRKQFGEYIEKAYMISLKDSLMKFNSTFQIILELQPKTSVRETEISFGLVYKIAGYPSSVYSSFETIDSQYYLPPIYVLPYKSQKVAGNALSVGSNGNFLVEIINKEESENILIEFWAKFLSTDLKFFSLIDPTYGDTLLSLCIDNYQMVCSYDHQKMNSFNEHFISLNSWNHFSIKISKPDSRAELYLNDVKIFDHPFTLNSSSEKIQMLINNTSKSPFSIDLIKVWDFENHINKSFSNKHYLFYNADSSATQLSLNFDGKNELTNLLSTVTESQSLEIIKSDAPIFSRAPELSVKVYEKFYSIDWTSKDVHNASEFILEKSVDGKFFIQIFSTEAEENESKIYFYSDEKQIDNEIVFYRLTQLNKDGSEVYSAPLKIGQGLKDIFELDQNYPNPFNPVTTISVEMFETAEVDIYVYDIVGNKIQKLHSGSLSEGIHSFKFDGTELPSGIYFYEIKSSLSTLVRKMILAK